jgi:hypothetical protein
LLGNGHGGCGGRSGETGWSRGQHRAPDRPYIDALDAQAFAALTASRGARAYYDLIRAREVSHRAALRQLANRLVGILHGCLKTGTLYDETIAWSHQAEAVAA